ncbi:hypothetical protein [Fluviicola sp.]|uniref:hypothetical protein n=1 Tax=Fluviicola sp. TaxID=1917219 RepID=UPI0031E16FE4
MTSIGAGLAIEWADPFMQASCNMFYDDYENKLAHTITQQEIQASSLICGFH